MFFLTFFHGCYEPYFNPFFFVLCTVFFRTYTYSIMLLVFSSTELYVLLVLISSFLALYRPSFCACFVLSLPFFPACSTCSPSNLSWTFLFVAPPSRPARIIFLFSRMYVLPICPASQVKKTKVRPDYSSAPTQLALCLRLAY